MVDRSRTRFHDKNWQKGGARYFAFELIRPENYSALVDAAFVN
jgi:hypothetical protein